jgi:hypothetical protein
MQDVCKKRKIDSTPETCSEGGNNSITSMCAGTDMFGSGGDTGRKSLPFTCICYGGRFYTTDDCGHFIHTSEKRENRLMRCEVDEESQEVHYILIRTLNDTEVNTLENVEDMNVVNDLTKFNKSLYY